MGGGGKTKILSYIFFGGGEGLSGAHFFCVNLLVGLK